MAGGRYYSTTSRPKKKKQTLEKKIVAVANRAIHRSLEKKLHDYQLAPVTVGWSGPTPYNLSSIFQGDQSSERTGRVITPTRLDFSYTVAAAATDAYNTFRVIIFQWKQEDLTAYPVSGNIFQYNSSTSAPLSHVPFINNEKKIKVLHDRLITVTPSGGYRAVSVRGTIGRKKLLKIDYQLGNVDTGYGNIYLAVVSDSQVSPDHPLFSFTSRLRFEDA